MPEVQFHPVWEHSAVSGHKVFLTMRAEGGVPQGLRAHIQPPDALGSAEVEVLRSSRDGNQFVVVVDGPCQLRLTDGDNTTLSIVEITRDQLARVGEPDPAGVSDSPSNGDGVPPLHRRSSDIRRIVTLERSAAPYVPSQELWRTIRQSSKALSFTQFSKFVDLVFSSDPAHAQARLLAAAGRGTAQAVTEEMAKELDKPLLFRIDSYERLQVAAEVFIAVYAGVRQEFEEGTARISQGLQTYLADNDTLPYLQVIYDRLGVRAPKLTTELNFTQKVQNVVGLIERKAQLPCLIELIWSYWQEEGMLVQSLAAITQRFQNRQALGERDPLSQLEIDPLRPLNHLLWRHVQGEGDRLSVLRRAHEYVHAYGFPLHGKAVAGLRTSDRRSKFLAAFHNLLHKCVQFYRDDDQTTRVADGFPVLNSLKETHYVLSEGGGNQFGDLPATARQEMLIEQWLLARPEMRDFLGARPMVAYPEPWMDRVDTLRGLKGWGDASVAHFNDLAVFGEQLLLGIRWDHWSAQSDPDIGKQWAREWRPEVQGYIHALRAALGVDLAADVTSTEDASERYLPPSFHLRRRLEARSAVR